MQFNLVTNMTLWVVVDDKSYKAALDEMGFVWATGNYYQWLPTLAHYGMSW